MQDTRYRKLYFTKLVKLTGRSLILTKPKIKPNRVKPNQTKLNPTKLLCSRSVQPKIPPGCTGDPGWQLQLCGDKTAVQCRRMVTQFWSVPEPRAYSLQTTLMTIDHQPIGAVNYSTTCWNNVVDFTSKCTRPNGPIHLKPPVNFWQQPHNTQTATTEALFKSLQITYANIPL